MPETEEDMASRNTGNHQCADAGTLPALATLDALSAVERALVDHLSRPLVGRTHDVWDRAEQSGVRIALEIVRKAIDEFNPVLGCPVCRADCAAANPPVLSCPMRDGGEAVHGQVVQPIRDEPSPLSPAEPTGGTE